jgi:hypothetical protein
MLDTTAATYSVDGPVAIATIDRYAERNAVAPRWCRFAGGGTASLLTMSYQLARK